MKVKLRDDRSFRSTIFGKDIRIGNEPVEVDEETGQYLIESFPAILEQVTESEI